MGRIYTRQTSIIPDALSRNKPIPDNLVHNFTILTSATISVQLAADFCRDMIINETPVSNIVKFITTVSYSVLMGKQKYIVNHALTKMLRQDMLYINHFGNNFVIC